MTTYGLVIDGHNVATDDHFDVLNPADGSVVGRAPKATVAQLEQAIAAASRAFVGWSAQSDSARQAACHRVADRIGESAEELAQLLTLEQGKPLNGLGSRFELGGAQAWAHATAALELPVKVLQDNEAGLIELHHKPIGVVASITPWNWPILIAVWHILPALRSGNVVVIKPSPFTPLSTLRLVEIINEVLPPGVVNCITGEDSLGGALTAHPAVGKIVFTGSAATGRKVMTSAASSFKRLTLELGGNDAGIVLPDADPVKIAEGLFWGAFVNGGQTCAALKRLYVHDSLYEAVCAALTDFARKIPMGNGLEESSILGPIQNKMQFDKVVGLVEDAKRRGGRVLLGGEAPADQTGYFYPITLIADLDNGVPLVDEEQFGPVLPIIRYHDLEEVITRANDNPNGLGGSVWSDDFEAAKAVALRLQCGSVWINKHGAVQPNVPFGGVKNSGLGVEFSDEGLQEYTNLQAVYLR